MLNLKKTTLLFFCWDMFFVLWSCRINAAISLTDLLKVDAAPQNSIVSFLPMVGMAHPITGIHLHYLTSSDCYSGYVGSFYHTQRPNEYLTSETKPFSLTADNAYFAGLAAVRGTTLKNIHSILIRLANEEPGHSRPRFAFFVGDCEDQDINCCMPVICDDQAENCLPQSQFPVQYIIWRR